MRAGRPETRIVGPTAAALGAAAQGLGLTLVGPAERIAAPGLRAPPVVMIVIVGELVVERVGTGRASLSGRA